MTDHTIPESLIFDFEKELEKLDLSTSDFEDFLEDNGEEFSEYSHEIIQKIFILQERTLHSMKEIGLADSSVLADAMTNLVLGF